MTDSHRELSREEELTCVHSHCMYAHLDEERFELLLIFTQPRVYSKALFVHVISRIIGDERLVGLCPDIKVHTLNYEFTLRKEDPSDQVNTLYQVVSIAHSDPTDISF